MPQIFLPSCITRNTKTLIDNRFCNIPQSSEQNISANLTTTYSDHLPQVLLVPGFHRYKNVQISNLFICNWITLNNASFSTNYKSTDWPNIMQIHIGNPNLSFYNYIEEVVKIISNHASLRKTSFSWNLVHRLIWIYRIQWWCSLFLFYTENTLSCKQR